ncbi:adhesion G protein-coupled receptor B2-like [Mizuhopecten yessoensis]|uniref:adhesion G protein-coupled receptor B2-like n=1 Tax=Mizuhopecten yessoensis TaxID=6573 RepID=UPI000B4584F8|nr:adhesion G protein-coupled receptor B2-like [Mizuhopecten yessoensis]
MTKCVREELIQAEEELDNALADGNDVEKTAVIENVIDAILNVTSANSSESLSPGDLIKTTAILAKMVDILGNNVTVNETKFVGIIDEMLSQDTEDAWTQVDTGTDASSMFSIVGSLGDAVGENLTPGEKIEIEGKNIAIKIEKPSTNVATFNTSSSEISLDFTASADHNVSYTAARYTTIGNLLLNKNRGGEWSTEGCGWVNNSCQCTHLTSFAVIMSPVTTSVGHSYVLRIISFVGCILSLLSTVTTMAVYIKLWRYVKGDRSRLLLNLCAALTVAYVVFIVGIGKSHDDVLCTTIAALLHYFFLVTFCLMLAEGIEILISVKAVFHTKSKLKWFLLLGWGLPALVVAVTVGVTFHDEYHSEFQ